MNQGDQTGGIFARNPAFRLALGACPALAVTATAADALVMGALTAAVLVASSLAVSVTRNLFPQSVKIPCHVLIVTAFASVAAILLAAVAPTTSSTLGIYVPLIAVNCLILNRAETFASGNKPFVSLVDGLVTGIGFAILLLACSAVRELLGNFSLLGFAVIPGNRPFVAFTSACGGFFALALVLGIYNYAISRKGTAAKP
ncbi:MAG TPA: Rnf-Nqr domain containing protein [Chitinivibrionales bacterium]|jgi:electron transport complex protein RnfE|nr:Rnf-Nqr domain containing protein [Chitinivibrionales bacterium]